MPDMIDRMIRVPNAGSYATMHFLEQMLGRECGGSTGCNVYGAFQLMAEMHQNGVVGSVVTLICDAGEGYLDTYYEAGWLQRHGYDIQPYLERLQHFYAKGEGSEKSADTRMGVSASL